MKIKVYTLNSLIKDKNGGNPAGVVLDADELNSLQMRKIAAEVGFSETAFIKKSDEADFRTVFFTPSGEIDLCGYATVAAFYLMYRKQIIMPREYLQDTNVGKLKVEVQKDGIIFMNQLLPEFYEILDKGEVSKCLGLTEKEISDDLPVQIVSTGLKDIVVPVKGLAALLGIKPDFPAIAALSKKYGVIGIHAFSIETKLGSTAHCRNFAPLYGIPEESATGTSNGVLGCYLFKYGKVPTWQEWSMAFEQGYSMGSPSEILTRLSVSSGRIEKVQVGGTAAITGVIEIEV